MSYDNNITVFRGVRITEDIGVFNKRMEAFIRDCTGSQLIQSCADYHSIDISDVNDEDLWNYLCDSGQVIYNEYLDSFFLGETCYSTDNDNEWRDLEAWTDLTCDLGEIQKLIDRFYARLPIKTYLVTWTS